VSFALPPQLFSGTPIPVSLWILKYPAGSCDQVLFIDAGRMGVKSRSQRTLAKQDREAITDVYRSWRADREHGLDHPVSEEFSTSVDAARIRSYDYSLNPPDYLSRRVRTAHTIADVDSALMDTRMEESRLRAWARNLDAKVDRLRFSPTSEPLGSLPAGWQSKPLHMLCDIQAGPSYSRLRATKRSADGVVPVVLPKHISNRRIVATDHDKVPRDVAETFSKFQLEAGDILCVRSGTTGPSALVEKPQAGWLSSTNLLRLRPNKVNPDYLLGYLSLPAVMEWIQNRSRATTAIPSISAQSLGQLSIVLPPLAEQRRIGAALSAFDEQIEAHLDLARIAEHMRAILAEHLIDGDLIVD
jgi:type I restriction enzyme M protein